MKYVLKRILTLIISLFITSIVVFAAFSVIPGDASITKLGTNATEEAKEALREEMGLNDPVVVRYFNWLKDAVRGDFGESLQYTGVTVSSLIADRLPNSAMLSLMAFLMVIIFSIPIGIFAANRKSGPARASITVITQITMGIPSFFLGVLLTYLFSLVLNWFQLGNYPGLSEDFGASIVYLIFPAIAIALPKIAMTSRFITASIRSELGKDYVRTAYAKGNSRNGVLYKHVLKNSLVPVVTFMGIVVADIVAGSIIVEQVFSVPGIGSMLVTAISNRDYNVASAAVMMIAAFIIVVNFIVDMIYKAVDPRVKI